MKGENSKIFKKIIRQRRAISSNFLENGSFNDTEDDKNKSKISQKCFHRKTTSSYFYGSYLSSNLIELLSNLNVDELTNKNDNTYDDNSLHKKNKDKDKQFINSVNFFDSNINQENNSDVYYNVSFHSYELDNSNIDNNNNAQKNEEKKTEKELSKKNEENKYINNEKNLLSFKNNLKYIKDKEERATKSYLLALGLANNQNKKEEKEPYLPTTSIIEEEKSDLIESKSEFSNKKRSIKNNYYFGDASKSNHYDCNVNKMHYIKKDNKTKIKENSNNNDNDIDNIKRVEKEKEKGHFINVNRNYNIGKRNENSIKEEKSSLKMPFSSALNEIISKKNIKEQNKRKYLKENKTILLNSFFMTFKNKNNIKNDIIDNKNITDKRNYFKKTENSNIQEKNNSRIEGIFPYFQKRKIKMENSYISNLIKKRFNTENNEQNQKSINKSNNLKNKEKKYSFIHRSEKRNIKYNNLNNSFNSYLSNNKTNTVIQNGNKLIKSTRPIISKIEYKLRSKIPHLRQKIIDKKGKNKNNYNYINNYSFGKNNNNISKRVNIPHKKNYSFTKDKIFFKEKDNNIDSMKQIKTINKALAFIRIQRMNSKKISSTKSKNSKNKNSYSSSFNRATRSNSKSSRSKENKVLLNKKNHRLSYSISS